MTGALALNAAVGRSLNPISLSIGGHLLVVLLLTANLSVWQSRPDQPVRLAIDAAVVLDTEAVQQRELAAQQRREEAARQRAADERRRQQEAEQRERERQELERQRREQELARQQAEAKKRQEAEARRLAEEQRQREAAERKEQERLAAEKRRREEEAARKRAEEQRRQAEREAQLKAAIAAEQEREAAISGGLLDQWIEVIRQKVQRNWIKPASAGAGLECEVRVRQIPGGDVVDAQVTVCNGDATVVRSIENAVFRSSPLPQPPDPSLFERNIVFVFRPSD
ncbi:MAG: cell envelope integrity protein TolA [Gammaproteobacteria bacterium]|nr:cell envelope integrity protein TolA [Gammaproteobacteria bacterium]